MNDCDGNTPVRTVLNRLQDFRIAERIRNSLALKVEFCGIDAVGTVDGDDEIEVDLQVLRPPAGQRKKRRGKDNKDERASQFGEKGMERIRRILRHERNRDFGFSSPGCRAGAPTGA